jgi:hypothetical protein
MPLTRSWYAISRPSSSGREFTLVRCIALLLLVSNNGAAIHTGCDPTPVQNPSPGAIPQELSPQT